MNNNNAVLSSLLGMFNQASGQLTMVEISILIAHSLLLGITLAVLNYITLTPFMEKKEKEKSGSSSRAKHILGATNILFICVGLTGVMILVNNNLARALSIGAALHLMRFRVNIGNKNQGSNMLFGIIAGVACGLQEIRVAWAVILPYIVIQSILYFILRNHFIEKTEDQEK